jgi:DedD protein
MRIPFLRPKSTAAQPERARPAPMAEDPTEVQAARTQARRRLVGALVLLVIGVVGFPVLFETQPRPLPIDIPIEAPRRDTVASGLTGKDTAPTQAQPLPVLPADAGAEEAPVAAASAASAASTVAAVVLAGAAAPLRVPVPASAVVAVPAPVPASVAAPAPAAPKAAAPAPRPAPPPPAKAATGSASAPDKAASTVPSEAGRYVVQAGAYSEAGKLREARAKLEKLGLKTYTQVIESDKGPRTRVRVGPYATRAEAVAVADKVKRSGVPAAILAL